VGFYKRRSQEKTPLQRLEFFCFAAPGEWARWFLTDRNMCSVAGRLGPAIGVSSANGFHRPFRNEACQFRNQQSRTGAQGSDHGSDMERPVNYEQLFSSSFFSLLGGSVSRGRGSFRDG
jgi:hypothetical protein